MLKKVKEIYFKEGIGLPFFVMMNGEQKQPYQMAGSWIWLTTKEHQELSKELISKEVEAKKPWYKTIFN